MWLLLGFTICSLYSGLLVCIYAAFTFTDLVTYPEYQDYLELRGFFIYVFSVSIAYILFIFGQVILAKINNSRIFFYESQKSHASLTVRIGAIIFGLGSFISTLMVLAADLHTDSKSPCVNRISLVTHFLALIFILLQATVIFVIPRINFCHFAIVNKFGTMHLVATNMILWIKTLFKESMEEIIDYGVVQNGDGSNNLQGEETNRTCNVLLSLIQNVEEQVQRCRTFENVALSDAVLASSPFLFPFIIEFTLIGASVMLTISDNVLYPRSEVEDDHINKVQKPDARKYLQKMDCKDSFMGFCLGIAVTVLAIASVTCFFVIRGHQIFKYETELISKLSSIAINSIGVMMLVVGLSQVRTLEWAHVYHSRLIPCYDMDLFLMKISSVFFVIYLMFTIITGLFNTDISDFPNSLHVTNGVIEIAQIKVQIVFIYILKQKMSWEELRIRRCGRHIVAFLFLFNLAQWIVLTFEMQKVHSSLIEIRFFGFPAWVFIQRTTLPMAVFFRFHSAVVSIELFKTVYTEHSLDHHLHEIHSFQ